MAVKTQPVTAHKKESLHYLMFSRMLRLVAYYSSPFTMRLDQFLLEYECVLQKTFVVEA